MREKHPKKGMGARNKSWFQKEPKQKNKVTIRLTDRYYRKALQVFGAPLGLTIKEEIINLLDKGGSDD